jgi:hypothetical protein
VQKDHVPRVRKVAVRATKRVEVQVDDAVQGR